MLGYISRLRQTMEFQGYSKEYINECSDYALKLLNKGLPVIFNREHFAYLIGTNLVELENLLKSDMYQVVQIPKKEGHRRLFIPNHNLKFIQKWMLTNVITKIKISRYSRGYIENTSLVDNAIKHVKKDYVITLDIKDFYPSVKKSTLYRIFRSLGYTKDLSKLFLDLLVTNQGLPQGAPSSPYLSHVVCKKLDMRIVNVLKGLKNCDFTRYADDITFSGGFEIIDKVDKIIQIINSEGFEINHSKTRIQPRTKKQLVTGLVVNKKVNIPREYIRRLKQEIYYCKKYGVNAHMMREEIFKSNYKLHLFGKAYYIKMINKQLGEKFLSDLHSIDWPY